LRLIETGSWLELISKTRVTLLGLKLVTGPLAFSAEKKNRFPISSWPALGAGAAWLPYSNTVTVVPELNTPAGMITPDPLATETVAGEEPMSTACWVATGVAARAVVGV